MWSLVFSLMLGSLEAGSLQAANTKTIEFLPSFPQDSVFDHHKSHGAQASQILSMITCSPEDDFEAARLANIEDDFILSKHQIDTLYLDPLGQEILSIEVLHAITLVDPAQPPASAHLLSAEMSDAYAQYVGIHIQLENFFGCLTNEEDGCFLVVGLADGSYRCGSFFIGGVDNGGTFVDNSLDIPSPEGIETSESKSSGLGSTQKVPIGNSLQPAHCSLNAQTSPAWLAVFAFLFLILLSLGSARRAKHFSPPR